ncbi:MAG: glycosyltransferase family 4 protein [Anaerolineae bacterium]
MRILHIAPRYWPAQGGAEVQLGELSRRLVVDGHQVTVATTDAYGADLLWNPGGKRSPAGEDEHDGVRILRFPLKHLPGAPLSYSVARRLLWLQSRTSFVSLRSMDAIAHYTPWVPELFKWLATSVEKYDLVMAMNICFESLIFEAAQFATRCKIPCILFPLTHLGAGAIPGQDVLSSFYTMRHQIDLVKRSSMVMVMTPSESLFYQAQGISAERIAVIGSAINPDSLAGGDAERFRVKYQLVGPIAFTIGTLCYEKGTLHTLQAMCELWRSGLACSLVLAGAVMPDVVRAINRLSEAERRNIKVLGSISEAEKCDLLAAGDIMVMPSRSDSFGIVYLEAWCYGKPVIGARTWGVQDVISEGVDGYLVPFGGVKQLAASIATLVNHPDLAAAMGRSGHKKAMEYTWDSRYPILRDVFQRVYQASISDAPRH